MDNPAPMKRYVGRATIVFAAVALLAGPVPPALHAQSNQPIYPAYDGYLKNPDGSYTLAFAYFSHNADIVTIPPGPANMFAPSPADRQQPTTFLPGHWRFQCVMVVDSNFDGKLEWTLAFAGTTTGTSQHMLQSNWNLVEGAEELQADRLREGTARRLFESRAHRSCARCHRRTWSWRASFTVRRGEPGDEPVRKCSR